MTRNDSVTNNIPKAKKLPATAARGKNGCNAIRTPNENKAGPATAERLHESILVARQMFISDVIDKQTWLGRID